MKSLLELLNIELEHFPNYKRVGYSSVLELITDDEVAAEFINHLNYEDKKVFELKNTIPISQGRARHSVISFLLGLVIGKFKGLFGSLSSAFNDNTVQYIEEISEPYIEYWLWMLVSTNHDYGYYSKYVSQKIDLSDIEVKYDLFYDDNSIPYEPLHNFEEKYPKVLKLPYEKIKKYFDYSKFYHEKEGDHEELCDHGILGGVLIYDKAVSKIVPSLTDKKISNQPRAYKVQKGYEVKVFDDCYEMFEDIKKKNVEYNGLCRMLSGLSFYWRKKARDKRATQYNQEFDFEIDGHHYCWNEDFNTSDFITNDENIDRIGCIYTSQGYDLNFAGVILGKDISYNPETKQIEYHIDEFVDTNSKSSDIKKTINNIIHAYLILLTRGMYGTYIYAVDKDLREYIKSLIQ